MVLCLRTSLEVSRAWLAADRDPLRKDDYKRPESLPSVSPSCRIHPYSVPAESVLICFHLSQYCANSSVYDLLSNYLYMRLLSRKYPNQTTNSHPLALTPCAFSFSYCKSCSLYLCLKPAIYSTSTALQCQ